MSVLHRVVICLPCSVTPAAWQLLSGVGRSQTPTAELERTAFGAPGSRSSIAHPDMVRHVCEYTRHFFHWVYMYTSLFLSTCCCFFLNIQIHTNM